MRFFDMSSGPHDDTVNDDFDNEIGQVRRSADQLPLVPLQAYHRPTALYASGRVEMARYRSAAARQTFTPG
ncbi:hypothetical protein [Agrobacterium pusense]|uniref:hypothetical protein n=1 Tax=Agrobacterium pusense TaxID=648995 RepID=UPI0028AE25B4|nr:hypothetical protein [Agrobacterium pusense]